MSLNLKYLIAARYVRSPKSHSVINIISGVSIVAMAVPVAAIVLLLSIFNGLEDMTREQFRSVDPDVTITPQQGTTFALASLDAKALRGVEGVEALSFALEQSALAEAKDKRAIITVMGVDKEYKQVIPIAENIITGTFTTSLDEADCLVASNGVMYELDMLNNSSLGQTLRLYAINRSRISSLLPIGGYTRRELPLTGIYTSTVNDSHTTAITSLRAAQSLFNYPDRASSVLVKIAADADANDVAKALQSVAGEEFKVRTREQSNSIYRLMALEKWGVFFIAMLVMVIASLSIVGTLVMVMIDKRDDMQTLRTLGATRRFVCDIFISEGHLMAFISLIIGLVLGVVLALAQQIFGFVGIDAQTLLINAYPVRLSLVDVVLTAVAYIIISYVVINLTVRAVMDKNNA
ncbi:MAG: ABC transporter permease [Alistipes sp.]|nr:ABC transporter permease [Alistipes sp.]